MIDAYAFKSHVLRYYEAVYKKVKKNMLYYFYFSYFLFLNCSGVELSILKVKSVNRSGTEAIRTQIQPSKPKREIMKRKTTNSQNTKRTYGQPSEQLFPKR